MDADTLPDIVCTVPQWSEVAINTDHNGLHCSTIFWPKSHIVPIVTKIQLPSVDTYVRVFLYLYILTESNVSIISNHY